MENKKLSQEELQQLKTFQNESNTIMFTLGQIDVQKALLEGQRSEVLEKLAQLQEQNNDFAKTLQEKYGDGNIDLETGEFKPIK
jgi:hypothetical protein